MRLATRTLAHGWTGPDSIPLLSPLEEPAMALAGAPMPPEEIRRRAAGFPIKPLRKAGWRAIETPNSIVRGDVPDEGLHAAGAYAEELNVAIRAAIGGGDATFRFGLINESREFLRAAAVIGVPNAESYYDPRTGEAWFWFARYAKPELFQRAFAHEFTHAFMDQAWGRTGPLWFAEGMAEYFSNLDWRAWTFVPGLVNPQAVFLLASAELLPLRRIFAAGRGEIYGMDWENLYAQSWSVVHFLFRAMPETVRRILEGPAGVPDPDEIEPAWREHVRRLVEGEEAS